MYSANNPINAVDLDGRQMGTTESYFRIGLNDLESAYTGLQYNFSRALRKVKNTTKKASKSAIDMTIYTSDLAANTSSWYIIGGGLSFLGGTALSSTGFGATLGIYMMNYGMMAISVGVYVNNYANYINTAAKVADLSHGGSMEAVYQQTNKTILNGLTNKIAGTGYGALGINTEINKNAASFVSESTSVILGLQNDKSGLFDYRIQNSNRTFAPDNTGVDLKYNIVK